MFHKPMYGATIAPACEYCAWGRRASDPRMILCEKCGIVSPYYKCRKFRYDPLRRVPKRPPKLPAFSPGTFRWTKKSGFALWSATNLSNSVAFIFLLLYNIACSDRAISALFGIRMRALCDSDP